MTDREYELSREVELYKEKLGVQVVESARWQGKYEALRDQYESLLEVIKAPRQESPAIPLPVSPYCGGSQ
jgi:hypothetical protein